ncbi:MAG: hypothetical protein KJ905_03705, partial [Nanoarchaeota archaeon]|nr:hypothetical protein [Nanoarchaeota archaeon]MBU1501846.1 hypothetical protein [Nanoarchaeota archaeon]
MKRGRLILISLSLIFLLSISFVSAGWFSDFFGKITGRVVDSPKQGDFNSDGCVNSIDLSDFQIHYGAVSGQANYESKYDLNSNDVIDFSDFITLAKLINEDSECVVQSASAATETDSAPATTTNDAETEEGGGINNNDATTNTNAESNVNSEETAVDGNSDEQIPDSSSTNSKASISKIQPESSQEDMSSPTGDFDNDGCVGFDDFLKFSESYGSEKKGWGLSILFSIFQGNKYSEEYDLNLDGKIDFSDFLLFVQNYG